jgi:hypothetical protein
LLNVVVVLLLHNGNNLPSIPVALAVHMEESYENVKHLLSCIQYNKTSGIFVETSKTYLFNLGRSLVRRNFATSYVNGTVVQEVITVL